MNGLIEIYQPKTRQVTPIAQYTGELVNAVPVYQDGGTYQPILEDLATKLMAILSSYQQGQISLECIQYAQNYAIEQSRLAHAQSLATMERMSDRALSSTESTIAHLVKTNETLANALATKSSDSGANVSVKVETVDRRYGYDFGYDFWHLEWFAWFVLGVSLLGVTLLVAANLLQDSRLRYQPQSAIPQVEVRSL